MNSAGLTKDLHHPLLMEEQDGSAQPVLCWSLLLPVMETLARYDLEEHIDEVLLNIFGQEYEENRRNRGISHWSMIALTKWLLSLKFLGSDANKLADAIEKECIDGETFEVVFLQRWNDCLDVAPCKRFLLSFILKFWRSGGEYTLPAILPDVPLAVLGGFVSDLRGLSPSVARDLTIMNHCSATTGEGSIYGQIVVLGHCEYRMVDKRWVPFGLSNQTFSLIRKKLPDGISLVSRTPTLVSTMLKDSMSTPRIAIDISSKDGLVTAVDTCTKDDASQLLLYECRHDPLRDRFQLGRALQSTNDFIVPGQLHQGEDGSYTGPISRWACRIECERLPPFRCFIFAGGFNERKVSQRRHFLYALHSPCEPLMCLAIGFTCQRQKRVCGWVYHLWSANSAAKYR